MRRPAGLTLAEIIICMGLMTMLTGMLVMIYGNSYAAFRRGTTRLSVQQRAREVIRRVTPLVMSSKAPNPLVEAVILPAIGASGPTLQIYTADNMLVPMEPVNSRNPQHYLFRIQLEADRTVRLERLNVDTGAATGEQKILAFNVQEVEFEHPAANLVKLRVVTRDQVINSSGQTEPLDVERTAMISIPYYSSTR